MAVFDFIQLQNTLKAAGFYDFVLPWLLAFAVSFGILQTVKVFKKGDNSNTSVDAIIAIVIAFYLTLFTPFPGFLSSFFSRLFGSSIIVLSGILVLLMFVGIFGLKSDTFTQDPKVKFGILIVALIAGGLLFFNAQAGVFSFGDIRVAGGELLTLLIFFGIIGTVIYFVTKPEKAQTQGQPRRGQAGQEG